MSETASKSALLLQIERERDFWERLLAEIGEERMLEPGATGDWTFKDVVAHLNGWRTRTLARLEAARHGHAPDDRPWPAQFNEDENLDEINDWFQQTHRERTLQQEIDEYRHSFQRIRDAVTALDERDLFEPGRFAWIDGHALVAVITATFEHLHEEHEPPLRAWLAQRTNDDA